MIIMLPWPHIKLKKAKKPIYKIALVPRISSFWSFQKAPDPVTATSSSGQPIPTSSNALGILQMRSIWFWGFDHRKLNFDLRMPAGLQSVLQVYPSWAGGRMRQEDGTNTAAAATGTIGFMWPVRQELKQTEPLIYFSGLITTWFYVFPLSPYSHFKGPSVRSFWRSKPVFISKKSRCCLQAQASVRSW